MAATFPIHRWRDILADRAEESAAAVLELEGVVDVIIGGSVGRGDPWPYSDIDLVPVVSELGDHERAFRNVRRQLGELWTASGWTHVVDVGSLMITTSEADLFVNDPGRLPALLGDPRLLHSTDKIVRGRGKSPGGPGAALVALATAARCDVEVRRARFDQWMSIIHRRLAGARQALTANQFEDAVVTAQVGGPLAAAVLEAWSEQEGSMTKFATRFERLAAVHGRADLAVDIAAVARSAADDVAREITALPAWLESRVELSYLGRRDAGEDVSEIQNRRDQVLLFLGRHGLPTVGEWLCRQHRDARGYLSTVHGLTETVAALRP